MNMQWIFFNLCLFSMDEILATLVIHYIEDITCFCVILNESVLIMHELRSSECIINTYEFNVTQKHVIFFLLHVLHMT